MATISKKGRTKATKPEQTSGSSPWSVWMRFELYGILIILLSIIGIAKQGALGEFFDHVGRALFGDWSIILGLYGLWLGFAFMIRRTWPFVWTIRFSGLVLFVTGILMIEHIHLFAQIYQNDSFRTMDMISDTWGFIWNSFSDQVEPDALNDFGGGMFGAIVYGVFYALTGNLGAQLFAYAFLPIGVFLITGLSFVELGEKVRGQALHIWSGLRQRQEEWKSTMQAQDAERGDAHKKDATRSNQTEEDTSLWPKATQSKKTRTSQQTIDPEEDVDLPGFMQPEGSAAQSSERTELRIVDFQTQRQPDQPGQMAMNIEDKNKSAQGLRTAMLGDEEVLVNEDGEIIDPEAVQIEVTPIIPAKPYELPSLNLLKMPPPSANADADDMRNTARKLESTLESFGVRAKVLEVHRGPSVTRFELQPDVGVKVSRVVSLTDDIALALAAKDIRIEAPIPGKAAIGIEVPNNEVAIVSMREMLETKVFLDAPSPLTIAFGRDISGQPIVANLVKMPHMLVAGATGSGKSVCINGIIASILYKAKPDQVRFLMIDPKMVELNMYNGIPHLLAPVVTDPRRASLALKKVVTEMEKRYEMFSRTGTRNIDGFNAQLLANSPDAQLLPYIVVIVDELADLMMVAAGDVEDAICRLAQMARAAGIHLIIATQRPSVDVITGVIKANIPSRIAFGVSSQIDSRTILDMAGAEKLLGRGDMLFLPMGASKPTRVQGAFISDVEVEAIVQFVKDQGTSPEQVQEAQNFVPELPDEDEQEADDVDELFDQAVQIVIEAKQASVSLLQRKMRIGYARAARLVDQMEARGIVGPYEGSKPREVLSTGRWKGAN